MTSASSAVAATSNDVATTTPCSIGCGLRCRRAPWLQHRPPVEALPLTCGADEIPRVAPLPCGLQVATSTFGKHRLVVQPSVATPVSEIPAVTTLLSSAPIPCSIDARTLDHEVSRRTPPTCSTGERCFAATPHERCPLQRWC